MSNKYSFNFRSNVEIQFLVFLSLLTVHYVYFGEFSSYFIWSTYHFISYGLLHRHLPAATNKNSKIAKTTKMLLHTAATVGNKEYGIRVGMYGIALLPMMQPRYSQKLFVLFFENTLPKTAQNCLSYLGI